MLSVAGTDYGRGISWLREFENKRKYFANIKFQRIKMKKTERLRELWKLICNKNTPQLVIAFLEIGNPINGTEDE